MALSPGRLAHGCCFHQDYSAPPHPYQPFNKKNPGASTRAFQSLVPTPLRIQRETPQTESCDACHGNADLFLTIDDIYPEEVEANWGV
ncbi:MAG: hypothetical protein GY803_10595, partial [Chloroflexi bacterium]|nr:hypothetical protein [Chloroflexota bacterium]